MVVRLKHPHVVSWTVTLDNLVDLEAAVSGFKLNDPVVLQVDGLESRQIVGKAMTIYKFRDDFGVIGTFASW